MGVGDKMKRVSILGSTGSIGKQALEVIRLHKLSVTALAAHSNIKLLEEQTREFNPKLICIYNDDLYKELKIRLSDVNIRILTGMEGLCEIARFSDTDILLNSVVGMVGLLPTLTAVEAGNTVALANKETLVAGGKLVMELAKKRNVNILPVDSEHSAIFQALQGNDNNEINKVILTASGGPFFNMTKNQLQNVTLEQALNHPNWSMGKKVTIDSSTLMNKGLEFIEAKWLFDLSPNQIEVVVHRQSVVHSAVEYKDYSVIAQMGVPDMKIPIQYALLYPKRTKCPTEKLSLTDYGTLTFEKPDYETFECLRASIKAIELGGAYPCIINAVNEVAVESFIKKKISFLQIGELITDALNHFSFNEINTYDDVIKFDTGAREYAESLI